MKVATRSRGSTTPAIRSSAAASLAITNTTKQLGVGGPYTPRTCASCLAASRSLMIFRVSLDEGDMRGVAARQLGPMPTLEVEI